MEPEENDIEQWARQLRGDKSAGSTRETDALRAAIRAEDEALQAAPENELVRARLMKRLENEGLFEKPAAVSASKSSRRWQPWLGAVAAMLLGVIGIRLAQQSIDPGDDPTLRGTVGSITIVSAQPEVTAREVVSQLEALGLEPRRVDNANRIIFEVAVSDAQLEAFSAWAAARNGRAVVPGLYRVFVDSPAM